MTAYIGVYLHGFLSSGNSKKGRWLKQQVDSLLQQNQSPAFAEIVTPTYSIKTPLLSVRNIDDVVTTSIQKAYENDCSVILLGSSMGGYYAQYFGHKYDLPYIMINPALNPEAIFYKNLGQHVNPATAEEFVIDEFYIESLLSYSTRQVNYEIPALLLIDKDDEVIDINFALDCFPLSLNSNKTKHKTVVYSGGDHSFVHMPQAWQQIQQFVGGLDEQ